MTKTTPTDGKLVLPTWTRLGLGAYWRWVDGQSHLRFTGFSVRSCFFGMVEDIS